MTDAELAKELSGALCHFMNCVADLQKADRDGTLTKDSYLFQRTQEAKEHLEQMRSQAREQWNS